MRRRTSQRGYVLLLTLLLLAVAAAALAGVSRTSLEKAVQAAHAQDDLQRRWTVLSCRDALLPKADVIMAEVPPAANASAAERSVQLGLGGQPVTLVVGDEQAKANVNLLIAIGKRAGAERAVRELTQAAGASMRVELSPMVLEAPADEAPLDPDEPTPDEDIDGRLSELEVQAVFEGWGQVFPSGRPQELVRRRGTLPSVAGNLTCWGDGMLNIRRASREAVTNVCDGVLRPAQVTKLMAAREADPDFDLWETLEQLKLSEGRLADAERLITDESTCYSLWIITRAGGREWYHLGVAELGSGGPSDVRSFEW